MTEEQWLAATDSTPMLEFLRASGKPTDRKLRLLGLACCWRIWHLLPDEGKRLAQAVEHYAEGRASRHERDAAVAAFRRAYGRFNITSAVLRAVYNTKAVSFDIWTAGFVASNAAFTASEHVTGVDDRVQACAGERAAQTAILRDIFGPLPFRSIALPTSVRTWNDGCIVKLATAAYEDRHLPSGTLDPALLGVLADALEEAGCHDQDILGHLREQGPHTRGCWCVDLLLAKE